MKIYRKVVMDLSGNILDEDSYESSGPMVLCKGGGSSSTTVNMPPPTATQLETEKINLSVLKQQQAALPLNNAQAYPDQALAYLQQDPASRDPNSMFAGLEKHDTAEFRTNLTNLQAQNKQYTDITNLVNQQLMAQITGKSNITPEQEALVNKTYESSRSQGQQDIAQFTRDQAAMRGLNISDSPVSSELARQTANFELGLGSAAAASKLNLGETSKNFNAQVSQFQSGLAQQSAMNKAAMTNMNPSMGIPLMNSMMQRQMAGAGQTTSTAQPSNWWVAPTMSAVGTGLGLF